MPRFGKTSIDRLSTCHSDLQRLFNEVVKGFDCSVICGARGREDQEEAYRTGKSKARFGASPHNFFPSLAVDVVPYPIDWSDVKRMQFFSGYVLGVASALGIGVEWGGDWDSDTDLNDQVFNDYPHFQLKNWKQIKEG